MRLFKLLMVVGVAIVLLLTMCSAPRQTRISSWQPAYPPDSSAQSAPEAASSGGTGAASLPTPGPSVTPEPLQAVVIPAAPTTPGAAARANPPASEPTTLPDPHGIGVQMHAYMESLATSGQFAGAVLVARDGDVVLARGYGFADYERNIVNTATTRLRLASLTKQFTAMAIMILYAGGRLNVSDPICQYLSPCPAAWQPITIRHLLSHTHGIANYTDFLSFEATETQPTTPDELISRFRDLPLNYAPGQVYAYGNSGYVLLGKIIENVSGRSYGEFVQEAIFAPLGMRNSGYDPKPPDAVERAKGYVVPGVPASPLDTSTLFAAGGLYSSVEDMYRWDQALYTDVLLSANLRAEMFTPVLNSYAYGWKVQPINGYNVISHPGNMSGAATIIRRYPDQRVTVVVLGNMENANVIGICDQLATMVLQN